MNRRIRTIAVGVMVCVLLVAGWSGPQVVAATSDGGDVMAVSGVTERIGLGSRVVSTNVTYGGSGDDTFEWIVPAVDDGYALVGHTDSFGAGERDFWVVKVDESGTEEWNRTYGGSDDDWAHAAVQTDDGGFLLSGTTDSYGAGEGDFWVVKVDESGAEEWNRTYGGSDDDFGPQVAKTADGGYALLGVTGSFGAGQTDVWLVSVNAEGTEKWNRTYGGDLRDLAFSFVQTDDGGFALAGFTTSFSRGFDFDAWLVKVDESGTEAWNRTYGRNAEDRASAIVSTADGGYALTGHSEVSNLRAGWLRKVNATGVEEWSRGFGGESGATYDPSGVVQTTDGGYALVMNTRTFDEESGWSNASASLVTMGDTGIEEGNLLFDGSGNDVLLQVHQNEDGSYALVGYTESAGAGARDGWLLLVENVTETARGLRPVSDGSYD